MSMNQAAPPGAIEIAAIATTVLCFVGTAASGGLLSVDRVVPSIVQPLHVALPVLTAVSSTGTLYLLLRLSRQALALGG